MNAREIIYVLSNFANEFVSNPRQMNQEFSKFLAHWLKKKTDIPQEGMLFETHCHTNFSTQHPSCPELADVISLMFKKRIRIASITDHGNSNAFDNLRTGLYNLNERLRDGLYEIEINPNQRSMVIHHQEKELVLLRSAEYKTGKGEIGIHGFRGILPPEGELLEDAIDRALDNGAWCVINHPYFMTGLGFNGRSCIEKAAKEGAIAIEKNSTEIPPQVYSPMRAERDAKFFGLKLVCGGDAHRIHMYGMSGLSIKTEDLSAVLSRHSGNHADAIKELVSSGRFGTYFNYITPSQWKEFYLHQ